MSRANVAALNPVFESSSQRISGPIMDGSRSGSAGGAPPQPPAQSGLIDLSTSSGPPRFHQHHHPQHYHQLAQSASDVIGSGGDKVYSDVVDCGRCQQSNVLAGGLQREGGVNDLRLMMSSASPPGHTTQQVKTWDAIHRRSIFNDVFLRPS